MEPSGSTPNRRRCLGTALACAAATLLSAPAAGAAGGCEQPASRLQPPCNPALAQSPWSATHAGSYAQGSSVLRGPASDRVRTEHLDLPGIPISILFSEPYGDGRRAAWGALIDSADRQVLFKVDVATGNLIDLYDPAIREEQPPESGVGGITGSYNMIDRSNRFIVPRQRWLDVYEDSVAGDRFAPIALRKRYRLPGRAFCGPTDKLVGATLTYGGYIAFATERGVVGTVPRQPRRMRDSKLRVLRLNAGRCDRPDHRIETVSNSIAADEGGGIYVVTSKRMRRIDHHPTGNRLRPAWSARYDAGSGVSEIRLGTGSGSTPSLMGTRPGQDRFVVITDGQDLMHVDLFWRDRVPRGWKGLGRGRPRRLACEHPVRFGDPDANVSLSEQSVAVRGYGTFHVNNALAYDFPDGLPAILRNALAAMRGGDPEAAPYGAERIDWDPKRRRCHSVWANPSASIPNGVPAISQRAGLAYGISQRQGQWGLRGLGWRTGRSRFFAPASNQTCSPTAIGYLDEGGLLPIFEPLLDELPNSCQNSFYAATEIGPGKSVWTGTFLGLTIYRPER